MSLKAVEHPWDTERTIDLLDYLANRLATRRDFSDRREYKLAMDRFDEAYMWFVAGEKATADAHFPEQPLPR